MPVPVFFFRSSWRGGIVSHGAARALKNCMGGTFQGELPLKIREQKWLAEWVAPPDRRNVESCNGINLQKWIEIL